jgi:hypothetical protein
MCYGLTLLGSTGVDLLNYFWAFFPIKFVKMFPEICAQQYCFAFKTHLHVIYNLKMPRQYISHDNLRCHTIPLDHAAKTFSPGGVVKWYRLRLHRYLCRLHTTEEIVKLMRSEMLDRSVLKKLFSM